MSPTFDAFLRSWPLDPWLLAGLALTGGIYLRGWRALRRRGPQRWHAGRPTAFVGGLAAIYLALASPIEPFAALLLQVHMLQHLLLMMAVPPLPGWEHCSCSGAFPAGTTYWWRPCSARRPSQRSWRA
jgi:cytochrome c oxidase assembly factor CtaG